MPISTTRRLVMVAGNTLINKHWFALCAGCCLSAIALAGGASEPEAASPETAPLPYTASYSSSYKGIPVTLSRELKPVDDGRWQLSQQGSALFMSFNASSRFTENSGKVVPLSYEYRDRKAHFNWEKKVVHCESGGKSKDLTLKGPTYDALSLQLQVRLDLMNSAFQQRDYTVVRGRKLATFRITNEGDEALNTQLGKLNTVRIRQQRPGHDSYNLLWLARDWDYLIVKTESVGDDDAESITIDSATIDGKSIRADNSH